MYCWTTEKWAKIRCQDVMWHFRVTRTIRWPPGISTWIIYVVVLFIRTRISTSLLLVAELVYAHNKKAVPHQLKEGISVKNPLGRSYTNQRKTLLPRIPLWRFYTNRQKMTSSARNPLGRFYTSRHKTLLPRIPLGRPYTNNQEDRCQ